MSRRSAFPMDYGHDDFVPGERIGPPLAGAGGKALLRGAILLLLAGGAWVMLSDPATWPAWMPKELASLPRWLESAQRSQSRPVAAVVRTRTEEPAKPMALDPPPPIASAAANQAPLSAVAAAKPEPAPLTTAALPSPAAAAPSQPLGPPRVDPSDPYQTRAAEVGLHPELSRVLLERLSPTDYRNAGIAIQTALAETSDNAVFVWPRQRKPELALFRVRFVAGAAPGCRRYVVTVVKDGWLTTALPMEKCGAEPVAARTTLNKRAEKRL
jgi:hypothetical protein